jgi:hypothetical protein
VLVSVFGFPFAEPLVWLLFCIVFVSQGTMSSRQRENFWRYTAPLSTC